VVRNWWDIMRQQKRLTWLTAGYAQAATIFPFVVAAPRYFRGEIPLGALVQTAAAFGQVQDALSFIVSSYTDIAEWRSVVERLAGFDNALVRSASLGAAGAGIDRREGDTAQLTVDAVELDLPNGKPLLADVNLSLVRGDSALLLGPSGSGRSTLVRAVAGIWPFGRGKICLPHGSRILFLPQKPYLPIGTLRDVVSYPAPAGGLDDAVLREALQAVGLAHLSERLAEPNHWALQLSPGEQQRVAFARALMHRPEWLFLDEATSALDEATETRLYRLLQERLATTTVFSVGHRGTLRRFHARQLVVQPNGTGPASIVEIRPRSRESAVASS
jgi:putative ATP-binding cassette transporter